MDSAVNTQVQSSNLKEAFPSMLACVRPAVYSEDSSWAFYNFLCHSIEINLSLLQFLLICFELRIVLYVGLCARLWFGWKQFSGQQRLQEVNASGKNKQFDT